MKKRQRFIEKSAAPHPRHFLRQRQPPSKLQTSPINLRVWINRLWALYGKPIRVKPWFRLNVWIKRLFLKNPVAIGMGGRLSGCCC
jgi:hypothetical protein